MSDVAIAIPWLAKQGSVKIRLDKGAAGVLWMLDREDGRCLLRLQKGEFSWADGHERLFMDPLGELVKGWVENG